MRPKTLSYSKWFVIGAMLIALVLILPRDKASCTEQYKKDSVVHIDGQKTVLAAELAATEPDRERGLSGRACIPEHAAMLFQFDAPGYYGIWMKAMHFPIDVVWLDSAKQVTHIEANMTPDSYPRIYTPSAPSLYVIELHTGEASLLGLQNGTQLSW